MHGFSPFRIFGTEYHTLVDRRVRSKGALHLAGKDVEPTADDHVLDAIREVQKSSLIIQMTQVSCMQPSVAQRFLALVWKIQIPGHDQVTADHDFPRRMRRKEFTVWTEDLHPGHQSGAPGGGHPLTLGFSRRECGDDLGRLGETVVGGNHGPEQGLRLAHPVGGHGRSPVDQQAQRVE